ncbi:hypothetical protein [Salinicola rhizosphaerae]|uniref:Nodulation protein NolB n=1 Tax=Salinicola rhizosphaerae TaxID=1443141 RepID=A0ABQ3DRK3_9GAMM|nr:hypothetical protein [Salinicola rhizosphaerae]GHB11844.1 hypothetical protein GCM10009038_06790 [Salinicola rhizosphaerae]
MTPVTPPGAGTPTPLPMADTQSLNSQNLFEHMASQAGQSAPGTSPGELGSNLLNNLDGFVDRVNAFSKDAQIPETSAPDRFAPVSVRETSAAAPPADGGDTPTAFSDESMSQVADSLARVFDHSIETTMVVRGATQVSGSANTLLRGQ